MVLNFIQKVFGDPNEKEIKRIWPIVAKINHIEEGFQKNLTREKVAEKTQEFRDRIGSGESLDSILAEAFALVKYACRLLCGESWEVRGEPVVWQMIPFDVQLLGGVVMHEGKIAEMKTGEGKTLVSTLPIYLNALAGRGVFLVTVNDYLAQRDAEWMGGLYSFLGMSVGVIMHGQSPEEKKAAYECDIIYGTNNEYGFDYLRDNMATDPAQIVQRELNYAIVDEVDSILIDEARTPLIISTPADESTEKYYRYSRLIPQLKETEDYVIDEKAKSAGLTEAGIEKLEKFLGMDNIYAEGGFEEVHHIEQALKAHAIFKLDTDYVVKDGEVIIVDEFTGRLMPGRRYSDGLHQAIEAKENVEVRRESRTLATVSFQNYFRLFAKLAGMTGTAMTEAEEFARIYKLETIVIPTHRPIARTDHPDGVYKNQKGKLMSIVERTKQLHQKGQPVLIGTVSIEKSELLSKLLASNGVPHTVLNAKQHEKEAQIVADAGQKGAVTIATNMAGRGTDIKLGEGVAELGGLYILGTERHESRRIDNQLRGRSGRQGDPGESQFFISLDDDLMRLFGGERVQRMMDFLRVPDDMPIENRAISNSIEGAQKKVEGRNFEIRKHLVEYDDVMNKHREIIYARRRKILFSSEMKNDVILLFEQEAEMLVRANISGRQREEWDYAKIAELASAMVRDKDHQFNFDFFSKLENEEEIIDFVKHYLWDGYKKREELMPDYKEDEGSTMLRGIERAVSLRTLDMLWMEHIDNMAHLRDAVSLRGYSQKDPLIEYKQVAFETFTTMLASIQGNTVTTLFRLELRQEEALPAVQQRPAVKMVTNAAQIEQVLGGGRQVAQQEVGRNDPCPCGSGKKYKKCHG